MLSQVEHLKLENTFEFDACRFLFWKQDQLFISADLFILVKKSGAVVLGFKKCQKKKLIVGFLTKTSLSN